MCGIAGRLNFRSGRPVDADVIRGMTDLIAHRGPDGQGVMADGHVGLGHRRLAIIDLSDAACQPMRAEDAPVWISFNGEIYNFLEIRQELERRGIRFRSRSDTEVLLEAYRAWGVGCLERLRGMFAFAVWDGPKRRLFLARDRIGKKPLCYRLDADGIAFASEPKALLADPGFVPEVDREAISQYLTYQYVPAPLTAFRGVSKLPAAHYLVVEDDKVSVERYWRLRYSAKRRISEADAAEELLARLRDAVRCRLLSDVPLGAFLSGGLDSSAVVALMAQESGGSVKTFSIGFEEAEYNELPFARAVANRWGTAHHEFIVRPNAVDILPKLAWHYGEPFADSSAVPTFYLAELTRRHVTVALNGDGGDENFAGYERYVAAMAIEPYRNVPLWARRPLEAIVRRLPSRGPRSIVDRAKRLFEAASEPREQRYARWMMHFQPELKAELCTPELLAGLERPDAFHLVLDEYAASDGPDFLDRTLNADVNRYLPDDLLVKVDIATMAHGLEARSPLLDHPLMEFAASLPSHFKLRGLSRKHIFKRAIRDLVPVEAIERPKMGFGVPIDHWFRGELKTYASDLLLGPTSTSRGYFHKAVIERLLAEHVSGVRSWHYQLWNLVMLELWHRAFIDRRLEATSPIGLDGTVLTGR
ncbi:MAG: asparagine synthase (glutamine-hydrolyzing) [Acidobacteria bacterium RIFCSPLOWO2_02_FULL_65_29]|nr:MAG: asparagine synthase (glutamine-hydrolyzing) [Acidobacteria bacterium RIFCSPLOWO2_02_FULL_65_29]